MPGVAIKCGSAHISHTKIEAPRVSHAIRKASKMELYGDAEVKKFADAAAGSLVVGRFRSESPNFVAIRAEWQATPYVAILNPWVENEPFPYLVNPMFGPTKVLDLNNKFTFDVSINEAAPAFEGTDDSILIRSGPGFFHPHEKEREVSRR